MSTEQGTHGSAAQFSSQEAASTQTALRGVLGLPPEQFSLPAFIGMISDEIEQLRAHGFSDASIADLISEITGKAVTADGVTRFYASGDLRGHGPA